MIRVSDITAYLRCPRMCYFLNKGHDLAKNTQGYVESVVLKELALTYASVNRDDMLSNLGEELNRVSDEIRIIYRNELSGIDDALIESSISEVRSCLENISSNLSLHSEFYASYFEIEPLLRSEKFGLTGSPDRLIKINSELIPSIIKTGDMPESGAWSSDRMQLTAYSILIEEKYNSIVERGFVEYARYGKVREVKIKRHERRKVLQIREKLRKIQNGVMPEKPKDAPCEHCGFTKMCEDAKATLASRFF